jgi:hypothetical protein
MKINSITKSIALILLLSSGMFFTAIEAKAEDNKDIAFQLCLSESKRAKAIMSARQSGVPLSEILELNNEPSYASLKEVNDLLALKAYGKPKMLSDKGKKDIAMEFANEVLLSCLNKIK